MPEEGDRDPDRAQDDVLPGRLERLLRAVVADQEGRGDRGCLDRDPQHAEVVGEHRQGHRAEEQRDQRRIRPGPGRFAARRQAAPGGGEAHGPDHGSMNADSASTRSKPPAVGVDPSRTAALRPTPLTSTAAEASRPPNRHSGALRSSAVSAARAMQAASGNSTRAGHQSRSSVRSSRSAPPNSTSDPGREHAQDQHDEQDVEGGTELDHERHPSRR